MPRADLVSRWVLDQTYDNPRLDPAGYNDLTPLNGPLSAFVGGHVGVELLAASSQNVSILNAEQSGLNPGLEDFSLSTWVYPYTLAGDNHFIIGKSGVAGIPNINGYQIHIKGDLSPVSDRRRLYASLGDSTAASFVGGQCVWADEIPLNTWSHIAVTFDRDSIFRAYLNGVPMTVRSGDSADIDVYDVTTGVVNPTAAFAIGSYSLNSVGFSQFFDGVIRETRYYNGVLTPGEVRILAGLAQYDGLRKDELARLTARAGVLMSDTGRAVSIADEARLKVGTGEILWDRLISPTHITTPYNQGQPPNAADQAVYTTVRE